MSHRSPADAPLASSPVANASDEGPTTWSATSIDSIVTEVIEGFGAQRCMLASNYPVEGIVTAPEMLDVNLPPRGSMSRALPATHNAFVYVYRGKLEVVDALGEPTTVPLHCMALLANEGDGVTLRPAPKSAEPARSPSCLLA